MDYFTSSLAGGGGVGTKEDPFTLTEGLAFANAGSLLNDETLWVKGDGIYPMSDFALISPGFYTPVPSFKNIKGYTSVITDNGRATIQRSGGAGILFDIQASYWRVENFNIDGQNFGTTNLDLQSGNNVGRNIVSYNAGTYGFDNGILFDCYSHDNGTYNYNAANCHNTISKNSGSIGYYGCNLTNFASYNDTQDAVRAFNGRNIMNGVIVGAGGHGIAQVYYGCVIKNISISYCVNNALNIDRDGSIIENMNFYKNGGISNEMAQLGTYYELDPQFTNPAVLDFTRTGTNLDDKGFSTIGTLAFNYRIDIGIDQKRSPDYPDNGEVLSTATFDYGNRTGTYVEVVIGKVVSGIQYGEDGTEHTGVYVETPVGKVILGIGFGANGTEKTGTYVEVAIGKVISGIQYGADGTQHTGVYVETPVGKVILSTGFGANGTEKDGTYVEVAEVDARDGTFYGAGGTEKEGSLDAPKSVQEIAIAVEVE